MNSIERIYSIPKENQKSVLALIDAFRLAFPGDRLVFLGYHGSSLYEPVAPSSESDIDLECVLDRVTPQDMVSIRSIITSVPIKVECQVRSLFEIADPVSLIHRTHYKIFMYFAYANGITLLGHNVYVDLSRMFPHEVYRKSFQMVLQLTWKDLRKQYLANRSDIALNKLSETFLFDALLYAGVLNYRELNSEHLFNVKRRGIFMAAAHSFENILSKDEIRMLARQQDVFPNVFMPDIFAPLDTILHHLERLDKNID